MTTEHSDLKNFSGAQNANHQEKPENQEDSEIEVLQGNTADKGIPGLRQRAADSPSNTSRTQETSGIEVL